MSFSSALLRVLPAIRAAMADPQNYSNAGSVIATQSGDKVRFDGKSAWRETLTANRTYYVRTDGSDANSGLTNDSGGALLTVQGALNVAKRIDFGGYIVTVDVQTGTYTSGSIDVPAMTGQGLPSDLLVTSSSGGVTLISTVGFGGLFTTRAGARIRIGNLTLSANAGGYGIAIHSFPNSVVEIAGCVFAGGLLAGVLSDGGYIEMAGSYSVTAGNLFCHILLETGAYFRASAAGTITVSNTPNFVQFINANSGAKARFEGVTISGSATGQRYLVEGNGVLKTSGAGESYFPGDTAGVKATGGVYT